MRKFLHISQVIRDLLIGGILLNSGNRGQRNLSK